MQYFRNTDLANTYHVSVRAVSNWIEATRNGRLDLTLHNEKGRDYVANTARNIAIIAKLVEERRKYRTTKAHKIVTPSPEFYTLFSSEQIVDIISNLEIHREIPRQYNYFDGGAGHWEKYAVRLYNEGDTNLLKSTIKLIEMNGRYLDELLGKYDKVNIIDIGPGNGLPVRDLLTRFVEKDVLGKYIAIDISPDMLAIAERNIKEWFGERVKFEAELRDVTFERFTDLSIRDYFKSSKNVNLVLFLGGTLDNFRDQEQVLKVIRHSLGSHDLLLYTTKLDSPATRKYFDFNNQPRVSKLSPNHRLVLDTLNLDESLYDVESGFDGKSRMRYIRIRLQVAVSIEFSQEEGVWAVDLNKNDTILLWRAWDYETQEVLSQFDQAGFELLQASVTDDGEYLLNIHRVKLATP